MLKLVLRLLSYIALAIAVVMAVLDATRSIAVNTVTLTPLIKSWDAIAPSALETIRQWFLTHLPHFIWDLGIQYILQLPGFVVFSILALGLALAANAKANNRQNIGIAH